MFVVINHKKFLIRAESCPHKVATCMKKTIPCEENSLLNTLTYIRSAPAIGLESAVVEGKPSYRDTSVPCLRFELDIFEGTDVKQVGFDSFSRKLTDVQVQ